MKTKISQFDDNIGKDIEGYYFLSDFKISSGKKGRYANVFITDCTGSHTARMWQETISEDGSREAALIGKVIHVYGRVDAYDGKGSLIIGAMNEAAEAEYEMSEIARCLSKEYFNYIFLCFFHLIINYLFNFLIDTTLHDIPLILN